MSESCFCLYRPAKQLLFIAVLIALAACSESAKEQQSQQQPQQQQVAEESPGRKNQPESKAPHRKQQRLANEQNTIDVVSKASRSVLAIQISGVGSRQARAQSRTVAGGSGFIVDEQGSIITNFHVVAPALTDIESSDLKLAEGARIAVVFVDDPEQQYTVEIIGANPDIDMALLKLEDPGSAPRPEPIPLGDSDQVVAGQNAIAIGNPFGLNSSISSGIISAVERERPGLVGIKIPYIQTDAAINPGNSGGPLLDSGGEVIGINNAVLSPVGSFSGIGLAVPVNMLREHLDEMRQGGLSGLAAEALELPQRPRLGMQIALTVDEYPPALREELQLPEQGVVVTSVAEGGPADQAGIRGPARVAVVGPQAYPVGMDIIVAIEGKKVGRPIEVQQEVLDHDKGEAVTLSLWRDGETREVEVALEVVQAGND